MLPGLIFLCQGCRRCLDNLPLKILSCLRSFPHQIKMVFTFYSCLISTAMMMRNAILRNNPVEGDMQKIGARWQRWSEVRVYVAAFHVYSTIYPSHPLSKFPRLWLFFYPGSRSPMLRLSSTYLPRTIISRKSGNRVGPRSHFAQLRSFLVFCGWTVGG